MDAEHDLEKRLGTPQTLALAAESEYRRRTFAGRHPIFTFIGGPFVAVFAMVVGTVTIVLIASALVDLATDGGLRANDAARNPPSAWEMALMQGLNCIVRFVPFGLSCWLFFRLAVRSGLPAWGAVACGIVAVLGFSFWAAVDQATPDAMGCWTLGFAWRADFDQAVQAIVPAVATAWLVWHALRTPAAYAAV